MSSRSICRAVGLMLTMVSIPLGAEVPDPSLLAKAQACGRCHEMKAQLASWQRGGHGKATTCVECHLPQDSAVRHACAMAADGLRHAAISRLNSAPPVIRLRGTGAGIVQANCVRCHPQQAKGLILAKRPQPQPATAAHADPLRACAECHRETSHAWSTGG